MNAAPTINDLIDTLSRLSEKNREKPLMLLDVDFHEHKIAEIECDIDSDQVVIGLFPYKADTSTRVRFGGWPYFPNRENSEKLRGKHK